MKLLIEILDFLLAHVGLSHPEKANKVKELRQRLAAKAQKMGPDPDDYDDPEPPQTQEKKPVEAAQQEQQQQQ